MVKGISLDGNWNGDPLAVLSLVLSVRRRANKIVTRSLWPRLLDEDLVLKTHQ